MDPLKERNKISRRSFLKGSAITLAAGGVLTACKPKTVLPEETAVPSTSTSKPVLEDLELIPQAYLNP